MKTFLFDVDDTLYDLLQPFELAYKKNRENDNTISIEKVFQACRKYSDEVFDRTEKGEMSLEEMHIYRISKALKEYGVIINEDEAMAFQKDYEKYQKEITLLPDMMLTLDYCKANKIPIGIISNGPTDHQMNKLSCMGISQWIDQENIFISQKVGFSKPNPIIFKLAENTMKLNPEETYFVGDSFTNDIIGAKSVGWNTIWYNPRGHDRTDSLVEPDFTITKENSLIELVKSII